MSYRVSNTMNSNTNTNNNNKSTTKSPYCKVCHDSGKPESVYTSHWVRKPHWEGGAVCCPTLLALNCNRCGKSGHTVKYCQSSQTYNQPQQKPQSRPEPKAQSQPKLQCANPYAKLMFDSDDEEEKEPTLKPTDFPQLVPPRSPTTPPPPAKSYANMAAKTPAQADFDKIERKVDEVITENERLQRENAQLRAKLEEQSIKMEKQRQIILSYVHPQVEAKIAEKRQASRMPNPVVKKERAWDDDESDDELVAPEADEDW
jgi:regulator of replication initiation timing